MNWREIGKRFIRTVLVAVLGALAAVEWADMAVLKAAGVAGIMAALSFVSLLCRDMMGRLTTSTPWWERLAWTFGQAFFSVLVSLPAEVLDVAAVKGAAMTAFIMAANAALVILNNGNIKPVVPNELKNGLRNE
jgi:hypothetical protein